MAVSTIVVNDERRDLVKSCLASLQHALARVEEETELIVVENGPSDGSVELVREDIFDVKLVTLPRNRGFAGGLAAGIAEAGGDWITVLLKAAARDPRAGSVAAQMRFADRRDVLNSAGLELDRLGTAADRLVGQRASDFGEREPYEVFGAAGGGALFRTDMHKQVGGFHDTFVAYFEGVDVASRAQAHCWQALYAPGAVVYHHHSATARRRSPSSTS